MKSKYKVGDKVKVREDLQLGARYGYDKAVGEMLPFAGKIVEITKVFQMWDGSFKYNIKNGDFWKFTDEMFVKREYQIKIE